MRIFLLAAAAMTLAIPAQAREPQNVSAASVQAESATALEVSARRKRARPDQGRSRQASYVRVGRAGAAVPPPESWQIDPRLPLAAAPIPERRARKAAAATVRPAALLPSALARGPAVETRAAPAPRGAAPAGLQASIARHAQANGVPESLVHRVIVRESRYNPRAVGRGGTMGLMQIKTATARGVGYTGSAQGLLDAETNLTYAVRYLAGAYRAAGGNADRAVSYYASGYYRRGVPRRR